MKIKSELIIGSKMYLFLTSETSLNKSLYNFAINLIYVKQIVLSP